MGVLAGPVGDRLEVGDRSEVEVLAAATGQGLALVTCHPTDGVLPTQMRRVVRAEPGS